MLILVKQIKTFYRHDSKSARDLALIGLKQHATFCRRNDDFFDEREEKKRSGNSLHCTLQSLPIITYGFPRNAGAIRDKNKPPSRKRNLLSRTRPTVLSSMPHTPFPSAHVVYLSPFTTKNAAYYMHSTLPTTINFHTNHTIKSALDGETL